VAFRQRQRTDPCCLRKQVHDIAKEAVETVYEHGAGHARADYETERDEQARRFRAKYGSNFVGEDTDKDRSNAAAYFVGVLILSRRSAQAACAGS